MKSCAKNKLYGFQYPLSGSLYFYTWQVHTEEGEELYNQKSILRIFGNHYIWYPYTHYKHNRVKSGGTS